jgi:hypothetical protein
MAAGKECFRHPPQQAGKQNILMTFYSGGRPRMVCVASQCREYMCFYARNLLKNTGLTP